MEWNDKYLYIVLILAMAIPTIRPLGLGFLGTQWTQDFYNTLDAVPDGSNVLVIAHFSAANWPNDYAPATIAYTHHMVQKNLKPVIFCTFADAPPHWDKIRYIFDDAGYVYGEDWILSPFYPGMEAALGAFTNDPKGVFLEDYYGNPTSELPLFQEINSMDDFAIGIIQWSASADLAIRQTYTAHGMKVVWQPNTGEFQDALTYYTAGMMEGVVVGIRGGAEYEKMVGVPGEGTSLTDALSIIMLMVPAATLLGNIVYFAKKFRGEE
jgi:hypothetical protein